MSDRVRYGFLTMLTLVLLRLAIGWHFYSEGVHHLTEKHWSSESFLKAAKGPLADRYQAVLPEFHHWEAALHGPRDDASLDMLASKQAADKFSAEMRKEHPIRDSEAEAIEPLMRWGARFQEDMARDLEAFVKHFQLTDDQRSEAEVILQRRQAQVMDWLATNAKTLEDHLHEWSRWEKSRRETASGDIPYQKQRITEKQTLLKKETGGWTAQLKNIESGFHSELDALLEPEQQARGPAPGSRTTLDKIDLGLSYGITVVGACLILGLFTRLACVLGVAFLLSIALSQPFWVADAQPTFNQIVEMLSLAALATVPVGRWGGLDFFPHYLFGRRSRP